MSMHNPEENPPGLFKRIESHVQSKTVGGLIELAPLLVAVLVMMFIIGYADQFVRPMKFVAGRPWDFPGIGLITMCVIFYLVGLILTTKVGKKIMLAKNAVFIRIPVFRTIYGITQQATNSLNNQFGFTRVVFVEWPREGMVAMGFVTGRAYRNSPAKDSSENGEVPQSMVVVYIPTVPNPTSGNLAFLMEDDLIETDISPDQAMKLVFSGGIVLPDSMAMARLERERGSIEFIDRFTSTRG